MSTHRKSVAFSEDTKVVAENGTVTDGGTSDKTSAEHHSTTGGTTPYHHYQQSLTSTLALENSQPKSDPAVDEVTDLFQGLSKKKKSKKPKDEAADGGDEAAAGGEGEFDAGIKKKKKKKPKAETDDFEAKLAEAGVNENGESTGDVPVTAAEEEDAPEGDMNEGTGIWAHDEQKPIKVCCNVLRLYRTFWSDDWK